MKCTLSKFSDNTELGKVADKPEGCAAIHRDLNRLEKRVYRNFMKITRRNVKSYIEGETTP